MSGTPAPQLPEPAGHPVGIAPHRGLSSLDAHAVDEDADHPYGMYFARCGRRLFMGTSLHDEPPGWICLSCLRWTGPRTPPRGTPCPTYPCPTRRASKARNAQ
jgi:hypothetical protein